MDWKSVKIAVGQYAAQLVPREATIGLGSGTTSESFITALATVYAREHLDIMCIASSKAIEKLALQLNLPVISSQNWQGEVDITFDGADGIDAKGTAIKGAGGALLREKIIAHAAKRLILLVDERKWNRPWQECTLPVCVIPFGISATLNGLREHGFSGHVRMERHHPFTTDDGLWIVDLDLKPPLPSLSQIDATLKEIPGIVETGIFFHYASDIIVGYADGRINHIKVK